MSEVVAKNEAVQKEQAKPVSLWIVILSVIAVVYILSFIIPAGEYQRAGRMAIPGTYKVISKIYLSPIKVLLGMGAQAYKSFGGLFISIIVMGGLMGIVNSTNVIDKSLRILIYKLKDKAFVIIPFFIFAMGLFGCFGTMISSAVLFIPLGLSIAKQLHADKTFGVALIIMGSFTGFMTSPINMLTVVMGQEIAGIAPYSGAGLRTITTIVDLAVVSAYLIYWAKRAAKNHDYEASFGNDPETDEVPAQDLHLTGRNIAVLVLFLSSLVLFAVGSPLFKFGVLHLASIMLPVALLCGLIAGYDIDTTMKYFAKGSAGLLPVIIFMLFVAIMSVILNQSKILDTIVYYAAMPLGMMSKSFAAIGMFIANAFINIFITSGSGQTAVVMPIMAPLADVLGISRQMAIFTLQCGDGFTNLMTPTSANLLPCLMVGGVTMKQWYKFIFRCYGFVFIVLCAAIMIGTAIGY